MNYQRLVFCFLWVHILYAAFLSCFFVSVLVMASWWVQPLLNLTPSSPSQTMHELRFGGLLRPIDAMVC